jgi:hypothetical protein
MRMEFESRAIVKERQIEFLRTYARESGLWLEFLPAGSEYRNGILYNGE